MAIVTPPNQRLLGQARFAESLAVAWMVVELDVALWAGIAAAATTRLRGLAIPSWAGRDVPALWAAGGLLAGGLLRRLLDA